MVNISPSSKLNNVRYEIRGDLAKRAYELEKSGTQITHLNIGNPASYGLIAPDRLRMAMIENISHCDAYTHQKGIFPAREAIIMQQQSRGIKNGSIDQVIIGNGVSELIDITLRALLENNDEVLIPSPDYPLWTASTILNGGKAIHYPCKKENSYIPDPADIKKLITNKTRALVLINPNNPTGNVLTSDEIDALLEISKKYPKCTIIADEIYDALDFTGKLCSVASRSKSSPVIVLNGVSKVYFAPGWRIGYMAWHDPEGRLELVRDGVERLLRSRLCASTPAQHGYLAGLTDEHDWLEGHRSRVKQRLDYCKDRISQIDGLECEAPGGAFYLFVRITDESVTSDKQWVLDLLHQQHVLVVHGSGFSPEFGSGHFRMRSEDHTV